jgi:ribonuclease HI
MAGGRGGRRKRKNLAGAGWRVRSGFGRQSDPGDGWAVLRFDGGVDRNGQLDAVGRWGFVLTLPDVVRTGAGPADGCPVTCNTCEWQGLYSGLGAVGDVPGLLIEGDSRLVINQLTGRWASKTDTLRVWRDRCLERLALLAVPWHARWIPREANYEADRLTWR